MPKPYVFICFDTEDPINPEADDVLLRLAQTYDRAGVPACFFMVGEKARVLRARGRKDVLDALRKHEIDYHGNHWFEFPEPALVYGNRDPWDDAVRKGLEYEAPGIQDVAEITGQFPVATCQHQNNHSPATTHAMRLSGVQVWNGGLGAKLDGLGWILGMFTVGRHSRAVSSQGSWGGFQFDPDRPNRRPARMDPKADLKAFQTRFDAQLEQDPSHIVILGHPTCWAMAEWWGWYDWSTAFRHAELDGAAGPYPQGRRWERGVTRTAADTDAHFEWTLAAARWLAKRNDIQVTTLERCHADHADPPGQWLTAAQIKTVARRISKTFDFVKIGKTVLSAADALYVLAQYVDSLLRDNRRPDAVQISRITGPVEQILIPRSAVTFKRQDLMLAARQLVHHVNANGRLPHALRAHSVDCGPGELLLALAQALSGDRLPDTVTVEPTSGVPKCAEMDPFSKATAGSGHATPGYRPDQIHLQGWLQSWSYRPATRV
jgi:hypothetical protein